MIMMDVNPQIMRRKVRRMLGKSHIGLQQDKEIQKLLGLVRKNPPKSAIMIHDIIKDSFWTIIR